MHYQQVVELTPAFSLGMESSTYAFKTQANVPRNLRRLPMISDRYLGLARGCMSATVRRFKDSWIGKTS